MRKTFARDESIVGCPAGTRAKGRFCTGISNDCTGGDVATPVADQNVCTALYSAAAFQTGGTPITPAGIQCIPDGTSYSCTPVNSAATTSPNFNAVTPFCGVAFPTPCRANIPGSAYTPGFCYPLLDSDLNDFGQCKSSTV